jgi:hypothetical protein
MSVSLGGVCGLGRSRLLACAHEKAPFRGAFSARSQDFNLASSSRGDRTHLALQRGSSAVVCGRVCGLRNLISMRPRAFERETFEDEDTCGDRSTVVKPSRVPPGPSTSSSAPVVTQAPRLDSSVSACRTGNCSPCPPTRAAASTRKGAAGRPLDGAHRGDCFGRGAEVSNDASAGPKQPCRRRRPRCLLAHESASGGCPFGAPPPGISPGGSYGTPASHAKSTRRLGRPDPLSVPPTRRSRSWVRASMSRSCDRLRSQGEGPRAARPTTPGDHDAELSAA